MCTGTLRAALALLALLAALAVGCGGDDDEGSEARTETTATDTRATEPKPDLDEARKRAEKQKRDTKEKARRAEADVKADREAARREDARDRQEDREFDEAFEGTPFERVLGELPVAKPPLYVQQYVSTEGSHEVYTVVVAKRFFCGRTPARRKAAVSAFYRSAEKRFRSAGIDDFVQVVALPSDTARDFRALAVAREGKVTLTARGRGKGPC